MPVIVSPIILALLTIEKFVKTDPSIPWSYV